MDVRPPDEKTICYTSLVTSELRFYDMFVPWQTRLFAIEAERIQLTNINKHVLRESWIYFRTAAMSYKNLPICVKSTKTMNGLVMGGSTLVCCRPCRYSRILRQRNTLIICANLHSGMMGEACRYRIVARSASRSWSSVMHWSTLISKAYRDHPPHAV